MKRIVIIAIIAICQVFTVLAQNSTAPQTTRQTWLAYMDKIARPVMENIAHHIAELTDDCTAHTGKFARVYAGHQTEAPAIFKRNGICYLIGSGTTGWDPNPARWFTAKSICGPWVYHGNPCKGPFAEIAFVGQSTYVMPVQDKKGAYILWQINGYLKTLLTGVAYGSSLPLREMT